MNLLSWILLALIALWLVYAVAHTIRNKGGCSCGGGGKGGCASCSSCGSCARCNKKCDH